MNRIRKLLLKAILFLCLCLLFYLFDDGDTPSPESSTLITILQDGEPMTLPLEEYLIGAVAGEMPVAFGEEALKAQAVAIRTYVLASSRHGEARVCTDSTCCLAYADTASLQSTWGSKYEENLAVIAEAVSETTGEYLSYGNKPIQAVFHASSGGYTEESGVLWAALPYLTSVKTPETEETVPGLVSTVVMTADDFAQTLEMENTSDPDGWIQGIRRNDSGRVKGLLVDGKAYTGAYIRRIFGLRSTDFDLVWDGESFIFTVTGHGHGVGMSQHGAKLLAAEGWSYKEILTHYYPGTALVG